MKTKIIKALTFLALSAVSAVIGSVLAISFWNWIGVGIFGLPTITFLQGVSIAFMAFFTICFIRWCTPRKEKEE